MDKKTHKDFPVKPIKGMWYPNIGRVEFLDPEKTPKKKTPKKGKKRRI